MHRITDQIYCLNLLKRTNIFNCYALKKKFLSLITRKHYLANCSCTTFQTESFPAIRCGEICTSIKQITINKISILHLPIDRQRQHIIKVLSVLLHDYLSIKHTLVCRLIIMGAIIAYIYIYIYIHKHTFPRHCKTQALAQELQTANVIWSAGLG